MKILRNQKKILGIANTVTEMNKVFDYSFDVAEERISELKDSPLKPASNAKRKKNEQQQRKQSRTFKNYVMNKQMGLH